MQLPAVHTCHAAAVSPQHADVASDHSRRVLVPATALPGGKVLFAARPRVHVHRGPLGSDLPRQEEEGQLEEVAARHALPRRLRAEREEGVRAERVLGGDRTARPVESARLLPRLVKAERTSAQVACAAVAQVDRDRVTICASFAAAHATHLAHLHG